MPVSLLTLIQLKVQPPGRKTCERKTQTKKKT